MGVKEERDQLFAELDAKIIDPMIEEIVNSDYAKPPPGSIISEDLWKKKTQSELKRYFHLDPVFEIIDSGFEAIGKDFEMLAPAEKQKIQNEWAEGIRRLTKSFPNGDSKAPQEVQTEVPPQMLDELMGLSEDTIVYFYKIGVQLYEQQQYQKASNVFTLLTMLNMGRPEVWIALGLSEQRLENYETALNAFAMGVATDIDAPIPYIHLAECCISMSAIVLISCSGLPK
jgi:tetratricopeptide (TPR) repeat protein